MIINGELQNGLGGGICQVSTTVFNAAFEGGLPIDARTNHALYISHYPLGRDATVNYPDLDLRFSNDTDHWLLLRTFVGAGSLTVNLYGTPVDRRVESIPAPLEVTGPVPVKETDDPPLEKGKRVMDEFGAPPRQTSVQRLVYDADGKLLYDNTWRSFYVGEPSLVRVGTKEPAKKPAEDEEAGQGRTPRRTEPTDDRRRDRRATRRRIPRSRLPLGRSDRVHEPRRNTRRCPASSRRPSRGASRPSPRARLPARSGTRSGIARRGCRRSAGGP